MCIRDRSSLDVSGLANLTYIDCYGNLLITLDISSASGLQSIDCSMNNLTNLVSANPALTYLNCTNNNLTSLDVSSNAALQTLYCGNNSLATLNVSGLTSLTELVCDDNQIIDLDLTSNTSLNDLHCENNLLTNLNVSGLTSLTILVCNDNQLTAIDVSSNTALGGLNCSNNLLTSLNVKNGNNTHFEGFDAGGNAGLTCIQVDNAAWSTANWPNKDAWASYSTDCGGTCINPVDGGTITDDQTICSGSVPALLDNATLPSGETGTLEYKWQSSTDAAFTTPADITNDAASYTPTITLTAEVRSTVIFTAFDNTHTLSQVTFARRRYHVSAVKVIVGV